jgi:quercetin dioxygenase-like cupin family protein
MRSLFFALALMSAPALAAGDANKPNIENLLEGRVTGLDSHKVLASRVTLPPNTILPFHHHPVEEFLYILEGEATVRFKDGGDKALKAGALFVIPAGRVHTAVLGDTEAVALIYRIHPNGEPVAVPYKD